MHNSMLVLCCSQYLGYGSLLLVGALSTMLGSVVYRRRSISRDGRSISSVQVGASEPPLQPHDRRGSPPAARDQKR